MEPGLIRVRAASPLLRLTETADVEDASASLLGRPTSPEQQAAPEVEPLWKKSRPRLLRELEGEEEQRRLEQERERTKALMEAVKALEDKRRESLLRDEREAKARMDAGIFGGLEHAVHIVSARNGAELCVGPDHSLLYTTGSTAHKFGKVDALWRIQQENGFVYLISLASGLKIGCSPLGNVRLRAGSIGVQWRVETVLDAPTPFDRIFTAVGYDKRLSCAADGSVISTRERDLSECWTIIPTDVRWADVSPVPKEERQQLRARPPNLTLGPKAGGTLFKGPGPATPTNTSTNYPLAPTTPKLSPRFNMSTAGAASSCCLIQ